jgi:hypothetical protein
MRQFRQPADDIDQGVDNDAGLAAEARVANDPELTLMSKFTKN